MHELPVIQSLFDVCMRHADSNNAKKVLSVTLKIGEASDLQEEWIQSFFDYLCKDTIIEGARLIIERVPLMVRCKECTMEFHVDFRSTDKPACPQCEGTKFEYVSGREYSVDSMEIV